MLPILCFFCRAQRSLRCDNVIFVALMALVLVLLPSSSSSLFLGEYEWEFNTFNETFGVKTKFYPKIASSWDAAKGIGGGRVLSVDECTNECAKYTECVIVAHSATNAECFMGSEAKADLRPFPDAYASWTSYVKKAPHVGSFTTVVDQGLALTRYYPSYMPWRDLASSKGGADLGIDACAQECMKDDECVAFAWTGQLNLDPTLKKCWLGSVAFDKPLMTSQGIYTFRKDAPINLNSPPYAIMREDSGEDWPPGYPKPLGVLVDNKFTEYYIPNAVKEVKIDSDLSMIGGISELRKCTLQTVEVFTWYVTHIRSISLETSQDGDIWTSRGSKTANTAYNAKFYFNVGEEVKYVRLLLQDGSSSFNNIWGLRDFRMYGECTVHTKAPTVSPTVSPTDSPTTKQPTTSTPAPNPTKAPSVSTTTSPTKQPTVDSTSSPTSPTSASVTDAPTFGLPADAKWYDRVVFWIENNVVVFSSAASGALLICVISILIRCRRKNREKDPNRNLPMVGLGTLSHKSSGESSAMTPHAGDGFTMNKWWSQV